MPKTKAGKKMLRNMEKEYGAKKGKQVFYATENKLRQQGRAVKLGIVTR